MSKIASYAELLAWKDGGPAPSADSVIALVGNLSAQVESLMSRVPPRLDEDLEPGVTRFKTLGQLRAEVRLEEASSPQPRPADLSGAHLASKFGIQGLDSEDPSVRESARQELLSRCVKEGIPNDLKNTLDRIQRPEAQIHVVHEEGEAWQGSESGEPR